MNSNLRNMIEDALDGGLSHEETYSYNSDVDMSQVYGEGEIEKLASALNYVATNLDDLGTTDEKLAELELLQEKLASGGSDAKAATEAAKDTYGQFYKNLGKDSGKSLGAAFGELSTARKVGLGGAAGLVGLGALYGGYKMLGGGSQPNTQVVKVSSLQDAKAIALTKMAQRYDIPVSDLEKIALNQTQASILNIGEGKALTEKQIALLRGNIEEGIMAGRADQSKLLSELKAGETKMTSKLRQDLLNSLQANPTDVKMVNNPKAVQANAKRILGGAETARTTRALESKAVAKRNIGAAKDFKNMPKADLFKAIRADMPASRIDGLTGKEQADLIKAVRGDKEALHRLNVATSSDFGPAIEKINPNFEGSMQSRVSRSQASQSFLGSDKSFKRTADLTAKGAGEGSAAELAKTRATDTGLKGTLPDGTSVSFKGQPQQITGTSTKGKDAKTKFEALSDADKKKLTEKYKQQKSKGSGGRANLSPGQKGYAVERQAAEKELGFLAKNRRALLGAGALGAAGLAGYGAYKAFGGGQNKAASFRGMRKLAEDRINPARIKAGRADRFSGMDIHAPGMSRSASPYEPIAIKAQRVRDTINRDMQGYVSNVGGGYNLDHYLNRFNK